jgi:hypothetical protein
MDAYRFTLWTVCSLTVVLGLWPACSGSSKKTFDSGVGRDGTQAGDVTGAPEDGPAVLDTTSANQDAGAAKDSLDSLVLDGRGDGARAPDVSTIDGTIVPDETYTCTAPSCCVPVVIKSKHIWVRGSGTLIMVSMVVERTGGDNLPWATTLEASIAGHTTTYTSSITPPTSPIMVEFPTIVLESATAPACDSLTALELRVQASTYNDAGNPVCVATGSEVLELQQPAVCPACPTPGTIASGQACALPYQTCRNSSGSEFPACTCIMNYKTGEPWWECRTP